jgi:hypothetical protein
VCPELAAGGARREAALNQITTGAFAAEGTSGFGLVALLPDGTIFILVFVGGCPMGV